MTEKRFTVPIKYRFSHSKIQLNGEPLTNDELVRILNTNDGAFVENFALKEENEQLHSELSEKDIQLDYLQNENKHFKQRNDRQAKRLDELYSLIEREDWQTLKGIIQEFQECEEQLQKEWECYE